VAEAVASMRVPETWESEVSAQDPGPPELQLTDLSNVAPTP
jgi:hypothetical protein